MRYDKAVVMESLTAAISAQEEAEEKAHQQAIVNRKKAKDTRDVNRAEVRRFVSNLSIALKDGADDESYETANEVIKAESAKSYSHIMNMFAIAAGLERPEPVKDTSRSDELKRVVKIFETGAPPEVSVSDLRGFGLLAFVQFR